MYCSFRWLILITLGLVIYYQTFSFGFVFDDERFVVVNSYIKDFTTIDHIFDTYPKTRMLGFYSFAFNYFMNGLNPRGYHIFNFIIHLLATGLVWGVGSMLFRIAGASVLQRISQSSQKIYQDLPFIIALLFLVHPCQTQAVSYISQRFESMATVFYLATVYCYIHARIASVGIRQVVLFILAGVSALLGILTKEVAVTIPLMLLAVEFLLQPDLYNGVIVSGKKVLKKKMNYLKVCIVLIAGGLFFSLLFMKLVRAGLGIFLQSTVSQSHDGDIITPGNYFLTQMRVFLTFVRLSIFPVGQNVDYDYPMSTGLLHPPLTLIGICLISGIVFLIVRLCRSLPLVSFGLAWMLITFSINLAPRSNLIFEHKLYLISFGFFLVTVTVLSMLIRQKTILLGLFVCMIAVLSMVSFERNQVWKDRITLWEDVVKKSPGKMRGYVSLGMAYMKDHRYAEAMRVFSKGISVNPEEYRNYIFRGDTYYALGKNDEALNDFNKAIAIKPKLSLIYTKRAKVYKEQKNYEAAFIDLQRAISFQPNDSSAYMDRGMLWMEQGHANEALKDLQQALKIDPYDYGALIDCAGVYLYMGRYDLAIEKLNLAQKVAPMDFRVYKNRAFCFLAIGKVREALKDMEIALRLNPNDTQVRRQYEEVLRSK